MNFSQSNPASKAFSLLKEIVTCKNSISDKDDSIILPPLFQHECPQCGKKYTNLSQHINKMHKKIRKAQCEKCGKTFYLESQLKRHEQDVHSYWDLETLWEIIEDIIIHQWKHIFWYFTSMLTPKYNFEWDKLALFCDFLNSLISNARRLRFWYRVNDPLKGVQSRSKPQ